MRTTLVRSVVRRLSSTGAASTEPGFLSEREARAIAAYTIQRHAPIDLSPRLVLAEPIPGAAVVLEALPLVSPAHARRLTRMHVHQEPVTAADALRRALGSESDASALRRALAGDGGPSAFEESAPPPELGRVVRAISSAMKRILSFNARGLLVMAHPETKAFGDSAASAALDAVHEDDNAIECGNVLKKRRRKMNKLKHKKRLRKNRYKSRK